LTGCCLALKPSLSLAAVLAALHLLAITAAAATFSGIALVLVACGLVLSAGYGVAEALLRLGSSVRWLELQEDGSGRWRDGTGREHAVIAARATWVGAGMVVLGLRSSRGRTRWLVLMPDSAPAAEIRRLRVWLKWRPV
jgi:hypothetical protein